MAKENSLHVGRDGVSLRGRENITIFVMLVLAGGLIYLFLGHLNQDLEERREISSKVESLKSEHVEIGKGMQQLAGSVDRQTAVLEKLASGQAEQNCIILADEKDTARLRKANRWSDDACRKLMGGTR